MKTKILIWVLFLLVLIYSASAAIRVMQDENSEIVYSAEGVSYTITATYIHDGKVIFEINDETSNKLAYHETYKFEDRSIIFVREILEEEVLEGPDKVIFNFYPAECADCIFEITGAEQEDEQDEEQETKEKPEEESEEESEEDLGEKEIQKKGWLRRFIDWFINWFIWWRD